MLTALQEQTVPKISYCVSFITLLKTFPNRIWLISPMLKHYYSLILIKQRDYCLRRNINKVWPILVMVSSSLACYNRF